MRPRAPRGERGFPPSLPSPARILTLLVLVSLVPARPCAGGSAGSIVLPIRDDYSPAGALDSTGASWLVWISSFADTSFAGSGDAVYAARYSGGTWDTVRVTDAWGRYLDPEITAHEEGITISWVELEGTNSDVWIRSYRGSWSNPVAVAQGPEPEFAPALCSDDSGDVWVAWQAYTGSSFDIVAARVESNGVSEPLAIANGPANDREPDVAAGIAGDVWFAWHSIRERHAEVCLRRWNGGGLDDPILLTSSVRSWSMNPSIGVDDSGGVWVAYYHTNRRWKYFEGSAPEGMDLGSIRLLRWDGERVGVPYGTDGNSGLVPRPDMEDVGYDPPDSPIRVYGYRPTLRIGPDRSIWIFSKMNGYIEENELQVLYWGIFGSRYDGDSWGDVPALFLPRNAHFFDAPAAVVEDSTFVRIGWVRDRRETEPIRTPTCIIGPDADIRIDTFRVPVGSGTAPQVTALADPPPWDDGAARSVARYTVETPGRTYGIYWGENHRHSSEFSYDGIWDLPFEQNFIMTYEKVGYDWIAPSDHVEWWSPLVWRLVSKWTDLFAVPGELVTLAGYERIGRRRVPGGNGDQNVIYRNMDEFVSVDAALDTALVWTNLYSRLAGKDVLCIPHHTADKNGYAVWADFGSPDSLAAPVRLVEVFQTTRGSAEYPGCPFEDWQPHVGPDTGWVSLALDGGYRLGFVSAADHNPANGFTAVLATDPSREAIFDALRERRCYGTTFSRKPFVDFRVGGALMGGEISTSEAPEISYEVRATDTIAQIVIVKNGDSEWYVSMPQAMEESVLFIDPDSVVPGTSAYYYLRAEDADSGVAWTSPVWVDFTIETTLPSAGASEAGPAPPLLTLSPLPFRPSTGPLRIVADGRNGAYRIYASSGRLVREIRPPDRGGAEWDGRDGRGRAVPTGVYLVVGGGPSGMRSGRGKVILIR